MVRGWFYPKSKSDDDDRGMSKPPSLIKRLSKNRWITKSEAELHFISESLGSLQKEGFLFAYEGPFTDWEEWYLDSVMAHIATKMAVKENYMFEVNQAASPADYWSEEEVKNKKETNVKILKGLAGFMKGVKFNGLEKKKPN